MTGRGDGLQGPRFLAGTAIVIHQRQQQRLIAGIAQQRAGGGAGYSDGLERGAAIDGEQANQIKQCSAPCRRGLIGPAELNMALRHYVPVRVNRHRARAAGAEVYTKISVSHACWSVSRSALDPPAAAASSWLCDVLPRHW